MDSDGQQQEPVLDALGEPSEPLEPTSSNSKHSPSLVALSKEETILLSGAGDVLICRSKETMPRAAAPPKWQDEFALLCCDAQCDDLTRQIEESSMMCTPWAVAGNGRVSGQQTEGNERRPGKGGLLGGSPAQIAPHIPKQYDPLQLQHSMVAGDLQLKGGSEGDEADSDDDKESLKQKAQKAFCSPPLPDTGFDEESIVPMRSFDYSHFAEGGNDMVPTSSRNGSLFPRSPQNGKNGSSITAGSEVSPFLHGVPTFFPSFSHVKIAQVSAHPLGSHALLISNSGLLYSYGLNSFGQLGIGIPSNPRAGTGIEYLSTPTIVTPLVENGGKAVTCAAGVSHSLVVVVTEARRLVKARSMNHIYSKDDRSASESIVHHQVYGFGRNDYMKIGLVSPKLAKAGGEDEMETVLLPRRVALRCKVRTEQPHTPTPLPPQGIFSVQASSEHSAALVRRASGDVELYTWGNAMYGALGLPQASLQTGNTGNEVSAVRVVPVPSFVASLSRTSNPHAKVACMLRRDEYPTHLSLGNRCSFVVSSEGRCFSFGVSDEGMLGLGESVSESHQPTEVLLPGTTNHGGFVQVRAGASHVVSTTRSGNVYAWGEKIPAGLANSVNATRNGDELREDNFQWYPMQTPIPACTYSQLLTAEPVVQAVPGFDTSIFITKSGSVLSCGKASGRLGQGDVEEDVLGPQPMLGGLKLFHVPVD